MKQGRTVVVSDLHAPFQHVGAWNALLGFVAATKPARVVCIGDFADLYALNGHGKEWGRKFDFERELEGVRDCWAQLEEAVGKGGLDLTLGNHETRLTRLVAKYAPEIESIIPDFRSLLGAHDRTVIHPYQAELKIGRVVYTHDVGYSGANAARQTLAAVNHSTVFGHSHRGTVVYSGDTDGRQRFCLNVGFLGNERYMTYVSPSKRREWQVGFGIVDYVDGFAYAQFIPFVNRGFHVEGKVYR
jgi:predicted phosphodiesterase